MPETPQRLFHFHEKDVVHDVPAASYSEARRKFVKTTGREPDADVTVEVTPIES